MRTNKRRTRTRTQLSTIGTDLGSVVRFNPDNFNSFNLSFVLDKVLQLKKTPITNPIVHSFSSSDFPDSFEVFHYDFIPSETGNNFPADVMINPPHKPVFSSRNFFQKSLTGTSAFALEFISQEFEFSFNLLDFGGFEESSVGCNSKIINPQVHTQNSVLECRDFGCFLEECKSKEVNTFNIFSEQTFNNIPIFKIFQGIIWNLDRNFNPAIDSGNRKNIIFERKGTRRVVSDGSFIDDRIGFSFFDKSAGLFDTGNSQLRGQSFSQVQIDKRMELNIVPNLHSPCNINTMLKSSFVEFDGINYNFINLQLNRNTDSTLHCKDLKNSNYLNVSKGKFSSPQQDYGVSELERK